jgi:carbamoyltransferase
VVTVLGVWDGLNASACLLDDGVLTHAVQEERFTNVKNQTGMPVNSINWIVGEVKHIDYVALSTRFVHDPAHWRSMEWFGKNRRDEVANRLTWWARKRTPYFSQRTETRVKNLRAILNNFGVDSQTRISVIEHHDAHAASAYYSSPYEKPIVVTADGSGDGVSFTVNMVEDGVLHRVGSKGRDASIGHIYAMTTAIMGFKPLEHEYKLMGLAPYGRIDQHLYAALEKVAKSGIPYAYEELSKLYAGKRFDTICATLQAWFEWEMLNLISGVNRNILGDGSWCFSGGDFMNVKANMLIQSQPYVKHAFFMPSASDESTSIGAAQKLYADLCVECGINPREKLKPITHLYLGPEPGEPEEAKGYVVYRSEDPEELASYLISEGNIVARCSGRMEFGAMALGNRSIAADPRNLLVVDRLNKAIKMRDFWMPFTPSMLRERQGDYLDNPGEIYAPYMITCFNSTPLAKKHIPAAMHRFDGTVRPQMVDEGWNPEWHHLIKCFEEKTGVGAVLNTSFNIHSFPLVIDSARAIWTMNNSDLRYLICGKWVVEKR